MLKKLIAITVLAGVSALVLFALMLHSASMRFRQATIINAREALTTGLSNLQNGGSTTNYDPRINAIIKIHTNQISIGGNTYQCVLADYGETRFRQVGMLAITTNGAFVWLDYKREPKIIDESYRAPRWRGGF